MGKIYRGFPKILDQCEANLLPFAAWRCVMPQTDDPILLAAGYETLKNFEGCWIKADAIICRLIECRPYPRFTLVAWKDSWHWAPLGKTFAIRLPTAPLFITPP